MALLDKKDLLIINELERNSRISSSKIAKKLRLSKDGVNYRIKHLLENKIITRFFIDIDVSKLGLLLNKVVFQFQNLENEDEIFNYLKSHPKIGWVVLCGGRWDAVIVTYVRDLREHYELVRDINARFGKNIHSKELVVLPKYYVCSRKWLAPKDPPKISPIGGHTAREEIDATDVGILKLLAEDARRPLLDIASRLKISSSLALKRIRALEQKKIILTYRIGLNLAKMGKEFCKSFIYYQPLTREQEEKIVKHCLAHPNVTAVTHALGRWDLELEMEVRNFEEFHAIMNDLKKRFKEQIRNYEAIFITKEYGIDYSTIL